jgi:hypothetical protein
MDDDLDMLIRNGLKVSSMGWPPEGDYVITELEILVQKGKDPSVRVRWRRPDV